MKSLFEETGGTYRKEGDYFIPNLELPSASDYQLGKYGRMRRSYLKEYRKVLYTNLTVSGTQSLTPSLKSSMNPLPSGESQMNALTACSLNTKPSRKALRRRLPKLRTA